LPALAELHCHSTCSDGTLTPGKLVARAKKAGLRALVLTDHDTVSGIGEAIEAGRDCGVRVACGIEINTAEGGNTHVLGYGIDPESKELNDKLSEFRERRRARIRRMVEKLNALGVAVDFAEIAGHAGSEDSIGRPHIADALRRLKIVKNRSEAFERFLAPGKPAFVESMGPSVIEAIEAIRRAGGWSSLAHPGTLEPGADLGGWVDAGLGGIEAYYGSHTGPQVEKWLAVAERYGLAATGGSDYHGPGTGREDLGKSRLPEAVFESLVPRLNFES
jgi:predicted metal-dependent phosphoesterase TrpH